MSHQLKFRWHDADIEKNFRRKGVFADWRAGYPFSTTGLLPADDRSAPLRMAERLHERLCAGCHGSGSRENADPETERPAWNLNRLATAMPAEELAARLFVGIRGEALMAMENPLADAELSALIGLYRR